MAVAFDAGSSANVRAGAGALDLTTLTVGSGSDRALVAVVAVNKSSSPAITLNWDATGTPQALTEIARINNGNNYAILFGLVNPTSGNLTLRLSITGGYTEAFLDAISVTGADQTGGTTTFANAATNTGTSTTASVTVTSAVGNITIDSVNGPQVISNPTQTEIYADNGGSFTSGAASYASGAASVTHQWTLAGSVAWASVGCDIVAAGAGGGFIPFPRPRGMTGGMNPMSGGLA